ncbi:bifunctional phosphatase PAP2/diacylglycerol kinase family protein [Streptantibioticus rubrisoli]|uniref:Phosphatase PAP2 family protein n=1 Tax=Streptantibioticus rubrisoli TaxID=1387313 RepID=A0ABT1PBW8_9ACTN|nr:bifunctional phosphatase PAP2/diacylglycerol kinase family protein [Streptantibioticus rubrisoli]MCQ4041713.1 phosphatase PAP2 family protein [Streptantibioticus rubrisoli]
MKRRLAGARRLIAVDRVVFGRIAARPWPFAASTLPRLSRAADHGVLWFGAAAAIAGFGGTPGRRAAGRGLASLALASAAVNTVGKRMVRRPRPLRDGVPVVRQLRRQPFTTSFPSGHAASAAAFAAGVGFQSPRWGALVAPVAASVAFSRVYTGVHYPSDVLVGAAIGVAAAVVVRALGSDRREPKPPRAAAPALDAGEGLVVVVNNTSGVPPLLVPHAERLRAAVPKAHVIEATEDDDLPALLEKAACLAAERGGALGVHGGDGTVNAAAAIATREGVPLAVFPGGTRNHLAMSLGVQEIEDTARAVRNGQATAIDLGYFTGVDGERVVFVNTFSVGAYPELVRVRERWSRRLGSWPASVLAALHVLRTAEPVPVVLGGQRRLVWLVFVGNCAYRGTGVAPLRRSDLADGVLDVRVVDAGAFARTRLMAAAVTGALGRSPVYSAKKLQGLLIEGLGEDTHLAYDGEVRRAPSTVRMAKSHKALVVYHPGA